MAAFLATFLAGAAPFLGRRKGQGELRHPPGRVETGQHERAHLTLLQQLTGFGRWRGPHGTQRDVAVQPAAVGQCHIDHGPVRGEGDDLTLKAAPDRVGGHKVDEREGFIDRRRWAGRRLLGHRWRRRRGGPGSAGVAQPLPRPPPSWPPGSCRLALSWPTDAFFAAGAFLVAAAFLGPDTFFAAPFFLVGALAAFLTSGGSSASATASSMAVDKVGSTNAVALRAGPAGGGVVGVMGQEESMAGSDFFDERRAAFLAALANSAALAGADSGSRFERVSAVAARLLTPRTGSRCVKIHPTPGTGLPPMSRPSSKSHGCSP